MAKKSNKVKQVALNCEQVVISKEILAKCLEELGTNNTQTKKKHKPQQPKQPKQKQSKYYAVKKGKQCGVIVRTWDECKSLVDGVSGARYKSFLTEEEALQYLGSIYVGTSKTVSKKKRPNLMPSPKRSGASQLSFDGLDVNTPTNTENLSERTVEEIKAISEGKKKSTKVQFILPMEIIDLFESKCASHGLNRDKMLTNMLMEWVI